MAKKTAAEKPTTTTTKVGVAPKKGISKTTKKKKAAPSPAALLVTKFRDFIRQTSWPLQIEDDGSCVVFRRGDTVMAIDVSPAEGHIRVRVPGSSTVSKATIRANILEMQRCVESQGIVFQQCIEYGDVTKRLRIIDGKKSLVVHSSNKKGGDHAMELRTSVTSVVY